MDKESFMAQYQDKRWYELSKKIKARDKNTCQMCGRNDLPVSVHHKVYIQNRNPWEYPDKDLICVCDRCHKYMSENNSTMTKAFMELKRSFREIGFSDNVLYGIISHLQSLLYCVLEGEDINDNDCLNFLLSVIHSTQDYNDLKTLYLFGVEEDDFIKFLYPNLYKNYLSFKK